MTDDKLGDWRIDSVSQLAKDYENAPAGTPLWLISVAKHRKHNYLSFATPSAAALCLNLAMDASARSEAIRPKLSLSPALTPDGKRGFSVRPESLSDLYYFFEQSMISVTMSFQAIEVFANAVIGRRATKDIVVKRKGGDRSLTPSEAERELSTEEKIGQALPVIIGVPSPRGNRVWQSFKTLKVGRDATIHLKSHDVYTRNNIDRESLFFYYLNHDVRKFPASAIKVISHFWPNGLPRWLQHAKKISDRDSGFGTGTTAL
jgi:hypothetical protein